jgi:hypothetical protein
MTRTTTTNPAAPRRRNALIIGGIVALAVVAGLLLAMVLGREPQTAAGDPSPSQTPVLSPTPEPSETPAPDPTGEPSQDPEPTQDPAPTQDPGPTPVVEAPEDVLPPGSLVRVTVESIKLLTGPTTEAMLLDTAGLGELVVITSTYLSLGFGPVEADGFVWYPVIPLGTTELGEMPPRGEPTQAAWMAVGNGNESWVEPVAARCPEGDPDLETLEGMLEWERVACFGDRQLTIEGVFGCGGCGGMVPGTFEPAWLASPISAAFLSVEPQDRIGPFVLRFAPGGPAVPGNGSIVRVTGHFDDPRSSECVVAPGDPNQDVHPTVQELHCRSQFVVDRLEVIGVDEDFPLS